MIEAYDNVIDVCDPCLLAKQPLVSVHMLAYRHAPFLAQAIEGVVTQVCGFPFELIIAEDCSPDATLELALTHQKRYPETIRVIHGKHNVGMHGNSRQSMPFCRGKYVAFCEGDDYWHDVHKLADQVRMLEADPAMVMCHTDHDRLTRFRRKRNVHRSKQGWDRPASGDAYHALLHSWSVMTATSMYRREVLLNFGQSPFFSMTWPFGDRNLLLFASLQGTIGYLDRSTATFRKMCGSASNSGEAAALRMKLATIECVQMFLDRHPVPEDIARDAMARNKLDLYRAAYLARRTDLMIECFAWLCANGHARPKIPHQLRLLSIKLVLPHWVETRVRNFMTNHLSAISA